ncbi:unnamed protein product [Gongylonema pulchrum]|uniref:Secreted protein n=1 Tax=Gongylonema pulchrum TaxID=637853 RepID=A0A183DZK7_9BILA|nr:unnamed protein product [Gongylonema pulchrum]
MAHYSLGSLVSDALFSRFSEVRAAGAVHASCSVVTARCANAARLVGISGGLRPLVDVLLTACKAILNDKWRKMIANCLRQ